MSKIGRILVAIADPRGESPPALNRGIDMARRFGASLHLYTCVYNQYIAGQRFSDSPDLAHSRKVLVKQKQKALDALARPLLEDGLTVTTRAAWDYPIHEGIVREVLDSDADLAIADTHARPKHLRWQLTNTDWQLIRDCPSPLLLARDSVSTPEYHSIIAAVDPVHEHDKPAALDHRILKAAIQIAAAHEGNVHAVHAYLPIVALTLVSLDPAVLPLKGTEERLEALHREALEELAAAHDLDASQIHMRAGDAEEVLPAMVRALDADLVVMGAVSRSLLGRLFIGSTAERVLDRLPCDVMVVKPESFDAGVGRETHSG